MAISEVGRPLRLLIIEDVEDDAVLLRRELARSGYTLHWRRVQTEADLREALGAEAWDLVISDYDLPTFDALGALAVVRELGLDLPFIICSGTIGEDVAVHAMKAGAHDFITKGNMTRLSPAIDRELREAGERADRRRAEEALRQSEQRFRTLVASIGDVVFTMDDALRFDAVYGQTSPIAALAPENLVGKTPRQAFGADAEAHERAGARALAGERVVYEWQVQEGAEPRSFQTSLSPLVDADGRARGLVGVSREISAQKRVAEQLLISDRMASVGTLAAGVAHEINNPLAVVITNLDFVSRTLPRLDPLARQGIPASFWEAIADARESADRAGHLVQDLKVFSRSPEEEKPQPVDLQRVLDSAARMARNEVRHRARLAMDVDAVPPVLAAEARLGQVFLNLIVNAAQSIPAGHAADHEVRLVVRERGDGMVSVEVRDTGHGIAPDVLRKLFTPFFTTKPVGEGTGLGLSICHRIVTSFGGRIEVESQVGKGSTFRVLLPKVTRSVGRPALPRARGSEPPGLRRGRVLIVDDEPLVATALARELGEDHDVVVAHAGTSALERLRAGERFDVILCDLMMPEMTGSELHAHLVEELPDQAARMIFVSGGAFSEPMQRFVREVERPVVDKPFDLPRLRGLIRERVVFPGVPTSGPASGPAPGPGPRPLRPRGRERGAV
jgi:PAS domain S-box-containing protein